VRNSSPHSLSNPYVGALATSSILATKPEGFAQASEALASAKDADFSKISSPTLIFTGEDEMPGLIKAGDRLERDIKGSKRVVVPRTGHYILFEDPVTCAEVMNLFIK